MKIKRDSWMYSLVNTIFDSNGASSSLCVFFWQLLLSTLPVVVGSVFTITFGTIIVGCMATTLLSLGYYIDPNWQPWMLFGGVDGVGVLLIGILAWLVTIIGGVSLYLNERFRYRQGIFKLTREYLEARNSKFCPRIEWE